jgi:ribosome-binding protein aMBF1 (putative translation factor)
MSTYAPDLRRERLLLAVTETVEEALQSQGISRSDLARTIRMSPKRLDDMLDGSRDMRISDLADIGRALGFSFEFTLRRITEDAR